MKLKAESEKVGLKLNIQKTIMASGSITSWETDGETVETVSDFIFGGSKREFEWTLGVGDGQSHFLGRLIRSLGVPKERRVWNSQGGKKDKHFFSFYIP